jgi:hypothetical protein
MFNYEVQEGCDGHFRDADPGLMIGRTFTTCQPVARKGHLKMTSQIDNSDIFYLKKVAGGKTKENNSVFKKGFNNIYDVIV